MSDLTAKHFAEFFEELHGKPPFPWQEELAEKACAGSWPRVIDLPTASGKTASLDVALFSLAVNKQAPRRIFFVVDRRVIVNEAFERMKKAAGMLAEAKTGVVADVADALKSLGGPGCTTPLDVYQLRGGVYRDQSWVRSPLQPTVVTSTVDQVGSRLLFRGYGVSDSAAPIHAALIANDALVFLDEAHCSRAFAQTLSTVCTYRGDEWAKRPLKKPFSFVEMTATPSQESDCRFRLGDADYKHEILKRRLYAEKWTSLQLVKGKADDWEALASGLADEALRLAKECKAGRVAVMVNRVATARRVFEILGKKLANENLHLLIGRMRPVDSGRLIERLGSLKAGADRDSQAQPTFVVSTQCLEVGADLDFDVLVTECASVDAILQRFGRLDRLGECGNARGCIMTLSGIASSKDPDPIYGHCLVETWRWLNELAGDSKQVNMGIESPDSTKPSVAQALRSLPREEATKLRRLGQDAPALLPAHLDTLIQTSPKPHAEPEVALFLHGRDQGVPEVQVVWRADLDGVPVDSWKEIVALCPPVSAEAMPVRLDQFRRWLSGEIGGAVADADLEGVGEAEEPETAQKQQDALIWRGDKSDKVTKSSDIGPNCTVVLSLRQGGWEQFGHLPEPAEDVAEEAIRQARGRIVLRIHERLWPVSASEKIRALIQNEEFDWNIWEELFAENREFLAAKGIETPDSRNFKAPLPYPAREGEPRKGWLLQLRKRVERTQATLDEDAGDDGLSRVDSRISLKTHTQNVEEAVGEFATRLLPDFTETLAEAARLHDFGKADLRFQAMLHGGDTLAAAYYPEKLAKSDFVSSGLYKSARDKSGLPKDFRHELVSLLLATKKCADRADVNSILHLIASHHGYCRPFAPVVLDDKCRDVMWEDLTVCASERLANPAHRLSSGVARRFWSFVREFGWWGSAYIEACLRLADWAASDLEQRVQEVR